MQNTGGSDGAGLCVFTSAEVSGRWQNVKALEGFQKWMTKREGGGYPEKFDSMLRQFCEEKNVPVPAYVQHTGGDDSFLDLAIQTGRMACITYGGKDNFYPRGIYHMVNLGHLDTNSGAIIDNNRAGKFVWMTRKELTDRWRDMSGGWAVVFLDAPPPPYGSAPSSRTMFGDCPGGICPGGSCPGGVCPAPDGPPRWIPDAAGNLYLWQNGRVVETKLKEESPKNFGVSDSKVHTAKRWFLNGREVSKEDASDALLKDDSDRFHLTAVGDRDFLEQCKSEVSKLESADRARIHFQTYAPNSWAVTQFNLKTGVTLRKPARNRIGEEIGRVDRADQLGHLVADFFHPQPKPMPAPAPGPEPTEPKPSVPMWAWYLLAIAGVVVIARK